MERYHREKRARNNKIDDNNSSITWTQPSKPSAAPTPTRRGQIMQWDTETSKKPRRERASKPPAVKPIKKSADVGWVGEVMIQSQFDLHNWVDQNLEDISRGDGKKEIDAVEAFKRRLAMTIKKTYEKERQVRSLMPNDEFETGGMRLVRALDDCEYSTKSPFSQGHLMCVRFD
jgi:hypothetical protein